MPPLPADFIHARACKLKCEKILTRPLQNVALKNYAISVFYSYDYVKTGLNFILISDKMILMNGGVSLERSGRKIAVSAGKC